MANRNVLSSEEEYTGRRYFRNISWSLIAGAFIALATQAMLTLLGQSIGFSVISSPIGGLPVVGFSTGAAIWWIVTFAISLFIGGWFAGRLSGIPNRAVTSWNGLASWGFAMLVLLAFLATPLGTTAGGAINVLNRAAYTASGTTVSMNVGTAATRGNAATRAAATTVKAQPGAQRAAVAAFLMMLLGAIASTAGGAAGAPREVRPYPAERAAAYERPPVETTRETETPVTR